MVFGDVFRQRADYSKGLFYSGRNGLFNSDTHHQQSRSTLTNTNTSKIHPEPSQLIRKDNIIKPIEFQKSLANLNSDSTVATSATESSTDLTNPNVVARTFANILKFNPQQRNPNPVVQTRKRVPKTIEIENPNGFWNLEEYGGVKIWVNSKTGEVSVENPNKSTAATAATASRRRSVHSRRSITSVTWKIAGQMALDNGNSSTIREAEQQQSRAPIRGSVFMNPDMKELMDLLEDKSSRKIQKAIGHRY